MTALLAIVAATAALNPPRTRLGLPEDGSGAVDVTRTAAGIAIGLLALVGIGAGSGPALEALEISPETFRIAAGFALVIVAAWMLFNPVPASEPTPAGPMAMVWPVAYPRVVSPETIALAVTVGASDGVGLVATGFAAAAALLAGCIAVRSGPLSARVLAATGRLVALLLVVVAIWLAIQGVREV